MEEQKVGQYYRSIRVWSSENSVNVDIQTSSEIEVDVRVSVKILDDEKTREGIPIKNLGMGLNIKGVYTSKCPTCFGRGYTSKTGLVLVNCDECQGTTWAPLRTACTACGKTGIYIHRKFGPIPCNRCKKGMYEDDRRSYKCIKCSFEGKLKVMKRTHYLCSRCRGYGVIE